MVGVEDIDELLAYCRKKWLGARAFTVKTKPCYGECFSCFEYGPKTGSSAYFVNYSVRMFSHINGKLSPRPLE